MWVVKAGEMLVKVDTLVKMNVRKTFLSQKTSYAHSF